MYQSPADGLWSTNVSVIKIHVSSQHHIKCSVFLWMRKLSRWCTDNHPTISCIFPGRRVETRIGSDFCNRFFVRWSGHNVNGPLSADVPDRTLDAPFMISTWQCFQPVSDPRKAFRHHPKSWAYHRSVCNLAADTESKAAASRIWGSLSIIFKPGV